MTDTTLFPATEKAGRLPSIDAARGAALALMVVYHVCWDLNFLGLVALPLFEDPFWLGFRAFILSSFLFLAGLSLVLAAEKGLDPAGFLRRLLVLAAAAGAISAASYWFFPQSPIFFGVLHLIATASVLGLPFLRLPPVAVGAVGVAVILLGRFVELSLFDTPWLQWIGMGTRAPDSNDFVPLFPWFGVVLLGIATGQHWLRGSPIADGLADWRPRSGATRGLAVAGRHSLAVYLVHQPVLLGVLYLVAVLAGAGQPTALFPEPGTAGAVPERSDGFLASCHVSCQQSGGTQAACTAYCRCVATDMAQAGIWQAFLDDKLTATGQQTLLGVVQSCAERQRAGKN